MSDTLHFVPFDAGEVKAYRTSSFDAYVADRRAAGESEIEAKANATASFERMFPDGIPAAGQLIGNVVDDEGNRAGYVWVGPLGPDPSRWWVWDIAIEVARRGQGLGRVAMALAESIAREHGAVSLGLNVFAHNTVARKLYDGLGYEEASVTMRKDLSP